jgi:type I restriction enzyme M protein
MAKLKTAPPSDVTQEKPSSDTEAESQSPAHEAEVLYAGELNGRPTIELRLTLSGKREAFFVGTGTTPVPSGVEIEVDGEKRYLRCLARNKRLRFKPEEVVRQKVLRWVVDTLGYSLGQISVEVPIVIGGSVHDKAADLVVYEDETKETPSIIIEVKRPRRKEGIDQLKAYMNATGAVYGFWTDGIDEKVLLRSNPNDFTKPIWRLPSLGETLDDIDEPLTRDKLVPVKDLYSVFKDIEQEILAHQTVDTFNEIFKVVFAKLYDERVNLHNSSAVAQFRMGLTETPAFVAARVSDLFKKAIAKWKDVYRPGDTIELNENNVAYVVQALQQYHLIRSGDVLGLAFELLVNQEMKGDMGQYFTPRQVVSMMVEMLDPQLGESVCDPAAGSGGFLIYAMRHVFKQIEAKWDDADDRAEQRKDYAQESLVGIDSDHRLVRVAKAYMIMENDGRSGIYAADSLDFDSWNGGLRKQILNRSFTAGEVKPGLLTSARLPSDGVDLILTNPPFAGAIKVSTTLRQYELSKDEKGKARKEVERAKLFVERCIDILKPGGRMAIVLPQGLLNNLSDDYVREFVGDRCQILASIGLHPYTFKPFTLAKTSILFLRKFLLNEPIDKEYEIFTAVSQRPGKTKLGRPLYLDDGATLDCDMNDIAAAYIAWRSGEIEN